MPFMIFKQYRIWIVRFHMMMCAWGGGGGGGVTLAKKRTLLSTVQNNDKSSNCTLHFQQIHKTVYMSIEI